MTTYEELKTRSLPFIKAYHNDLLVHDKNDLEKNPGTPFLHFTGETGTYIFMMVPGDDYPAKGETVKYLFGYATRDEILDGNVVVIPDMEKRYSRGDLAQHFDGNTLKAVTYNQATEIAHNYKFQIKREWS
jgi:hypothetical protein